MSDEPLPGTGNRPWFHYEISAGSITARPVSREGNIACVVSVTVASQGFVLQYYLGGAVDVGRSLGAIAAAMAGTHVLIGLGEGIITAFTVTYVAKVRPDLVYAVRNQRRPVTREAVSA